MNEEIKKKMLLVGSILYKSNVSIEEGKIIGHFIEELVQEKDNLQNNWNELKKWLSEQITNFQMAGDFGEFNINIEDLEIVLDKMTELERGEE